MPETNHIPTQKSLDPENYGKGPKETEKWKYRSIIGKMNCIAVNLRGGISFAFLQCEKHYNNFKLLHNKSVKWIGGHLKNTKTKGMPNSKLSTYIDENFLKHVTDTVLS